MDDLVSPTALRFDGRPPDWYRWRDGLPRLAARVLADWDLRPDGGAWTGECSLVLGVQDSDSRPAALKLGWPHPEARHEHLALREWGGEGSARLLRADPARGSLLLERLGEADLTTVDVLEACEVVGGLYRRLHRTATPQFDRLAQRAAGWSQRLQQLPASAPVPHRLVEQAAALANEFAVDSATNGTLIHTDLHYTNVLAGRREPWLAIDPKPLSGDPAFEVAPMLWNRWHEAVATGNIRGAIRARMGVLTWFSGLDEDRTRDWVIVRSLVNVLSTLEDSTALDTAERSWITTNVTIAKAVQG